MQAWKTRASVRSVILAGADESRRQDLSELLRYRQFEGQSVSIVSDVDVNDVGALLQWPFANFGMRILRSLSNPFKLIDRPCVRVKRGVHGNPESPPVFEVHLALPTATIDLIARIVGGGEGVGQGPHES